ncbi:rhodopsin-like [Paramacrobiotus metropolitanus]|uniref:rhodopsin-like n=1 Tax=Paramacrobiotus metropolitanus TaxID=2943436 RepID=UPI002445AEEE|nr:rhodopsin-like [Paramacrobiotus metropolitanus]
MINPVALLLTVSQTSLRTPFNMYVVALMCSNLEYACGSSTLIIVADAYGTYWLGNFHCTVRPYFLYVVVPMIYHYHLLITLNRAWALFGPIFYRARHNHAVAGILCGAVAVYAHVFMLPQVILDHVYYRLPLEKGCRLNLASQFVLTEFTSIWMFDVPCVVIYVAYPFLLGKLLYRRRTRPGTATAQHEAFNRSFTLLTLYTFSSLVCWLPSMCYYTILSNYPSVRMGPVVLQVTSTLYNLQPILDPLFFCLTFGNVRHCALRLC